MTQVWPAFGVAPVPALVSSIFKPDAVVVILLPEVCAAAGVVKPAASHVAPASATESASVGARRKARILVLLRFARVSGRPVYCLFARAATCLRLPRARA